MKPELQQRFLLLDALRVELEDALSGLTEAQISWKLGPGIWSVRQIVEHIALSGETVGQPTPNPSPEPLPLRLLPRGLRRRMLIAAFGRDVALPLPSPNLDPKGDVPLAASLARWQAAHDAMRRDLESPDIDRLGYSHPVLGPLSARQMLDIGFAHTAYHVRQVKAVLQHAPPPTSG